MGIAYTGFSLTAAALHMPFRVVILWILLALLPLRGWAMSDMQVSMATGTLAAVASQQVANAPPVHASPPCHGESAQQTSAGTDESRVESGAHSGCSLCDLCHSVAIVTTSTMPSLAPSTVSQASPWAGTDTGLALIGRLDRPPRAPLLA
jgi:hypothetical protein